MHFTGRTWRPPYEAYSVIIQATSGCTYNKCRFCSLYHGECFRMSPLSEFEADLAEIKKYQPYARRIFWTGANPFDMTGLAGKGKGWSNAVNTAKIFNQLNPYFIGIDSLTLFPDTELYEWAQTGKFIPAGEHELIKELIVLLEHLQIRTHILADTKSNFKPLTGYIPKEKAKLIGQLQYVIDTVDEQEMIDYRNSLHSL